MNKIMVTGGAGYIGSHVAAALLRAGYEVLVVDNFVNSHREAISRIGSAAGKQPLLAEANCASTEQMRSVFEAHPDVIGIIHLAALKSVSESVLFPMRYHCNNVIATQVLLGEAAAQGIPLVFSSSCLVYGSPAQLPVSERTELSKAASPYAASKRLSELLIEQCVNDCASMSAITLRYFNPIGAHPSGLLGEQPNKPENLLPLMIDVAIGRKDALTIYGNNYPTRDGTAIRDYFHVMDLADAHVDALKRMLNKHNHSRYEVFNLGSGNGVSVLEMVHAFEQATGQSISKRIGDRRPGDIAAIWADTHLAQTELGWQPSRTLADAISSAWAFSQNTNKQ